MNEPVIQLTNISKQFGHQVVLDAIDLTVQSGKIAGLIGPSGAGKSTLIKIILGMEVPDSGQVSVFNTQMPNRKLLAKIGYMAQADALYMELSGRENLAFYASMKGIKDSESKSAITHVVDVVGLNNALNHRVKTYSGGMQRRLSLAIALLGKPDLLILDEPTVGIDPALRLKIWDELHRIRDQGRTILVTTHVMDEAELTDDVALLLNGKIIAYDSPKTLETTYHVDSIEKVFLKAEEQINDTYSSNR